MEWAEREGAGGSAQIGGRRSTIRRSLGSARACASVAAGSSAYHLRVTVESVAHARSTRLTIDRSDLLLTVCLVVTVHPLFIGLLHARHRIKQSSRRARELLFLPLMWKSANSRNGDFASILFENMDQMS